MAIATQPAEGTIYSTTLLDKKNLPTMYDLPSELPEDPGVPDEFHIYQPQLLRETFQPSQYLPDRYLVGTDLNLYYDPSHTRWHKRPDWFAVLGAPRFFHQRDLRLSYVVWQEELVPYLIVELLSPGTETEDLGRTPWDVDTTPTKWVVYEQILKVPYYATYSRYTNEFKAFGRVSGGYKALSLEDNRLWLEEAGLGLGVWAGRFDGYIGKWLRFYDQEGQWIPCRSELLAQERQRANQEAQRANQEAQRANQEAERANQEALARQAAEKELIRLRTLLQTR